MKLVWRPKAQSTETHPPAKTTSPLQALSIAGHSSSGTRCQQPPQPLSHVFQDPNISNVQTTPSVDFIAPGDPLAPFLGNSEHTVRRPTRVFFAAPSLQRSNALRRLYRSRTPRPNARHRLKVLEPVVPLVASSTGLEPRSDLHDGLDDDDIEPLNLGPPLVPVPGPPTYESRDTEDSEDYYEADNRDRANTIVDHSRTRSNLMAEPEPVIDSSLGCIPKLMSKTTNTCPCLLGLWSRIKNQPAWDGDGSHKTRIRKFEEASDCSLSRKVGI